MNNKIFTKIIFSLFLFIPLTLNARSDVIETTLDNGMTVLIKENHTSKSAALRLYVKAGAIYEGKYLGSGISHYCEHLIAGGTTKNHPEKYFDDLKQKIGANYNAYTSEGHTCYHITVNSKYFDETLGMLSDWAMNCAFDSSQVKREKGVIFKEILMGETPQEKADELFDKTFYKNHPLQNPIIGYSAIFKQITRANILDYYNRMYVPDNMVFVAVGDFNKDTALAKIKKAFEKFDRKSIEFPTLPQVPKQASRLDLATEMDISATKLTIGYHTVDLFDKDSYALDILSDILSTKKNSRLPTILKEQKQLVNYVYSYSYTPSYAGGAFVISLETTNPKNIKEIKDIIFQEIEKLKKEYVSDNELDKAKKRIIANRLLHNQDIESQASEIGENWLSTRDPNFSDVYVTESKKVTKEDIKKVVNKYFYDENMVAILINPRGVPTDTAVLPGTLAGNPIEEVKKIKLNNGATVLLRKNSYFPTVSVKIDFKCGTRFENETNNGISNFLAEMLKKGTNKRTAEQVAEEFEKIGTSCKISASKDVLSLNTDVLKENLDSVLEVIADMLFNSKFPEEEIKKLQKEIISDIKREEDDPVTVAGKFFYRQIYTKHPYGFPTLGNEKTISSITAKDIKLYCEKFLNPDNMVIGIFGDFDEKTITAKVEKIFGQLKSRKTTFPEIPEEPELAGNKELVNKYIHPQTTIFWGFPTVKLGDKDYYALSLIEDLLNGNSSRLNRALRQEQDLVYYAYGRQRMYVDRSVFVISGQTSKENCDKVISILKKEIEKLKKEPVPQEELENAKNEIINLCSTVYYQTNSEQADIKVYYECLGLGYGFLEEFLENLRKVTSSDILQVANKYFNNSVLTSSIPE